MIDVLNGSPQFQSLDYRGISGNVNVMSYSLLFKLPFLVYYLFKENNYKYYIYILIILISYAITTILQTRSAILSLILIAFILSVLFYILNNSRNVVKVFKKILLPISLGFILSFAQSNFITSSNLQQRVSTLLDAEDSQ